MALPKYPIKKIPNNEPDAVPALWNGTYEEIDQNLNNLDTRLFSRESEINDARGGKSSLGARLSEMSDSIATSDIDMLNSAFATIKLAMDHAALANYGVKALRQQAQQEGVVTIQNRGIVTGCTISKSTTASRNVNIAPGVCFAKGRTFSVSEGENAASVPSNITNASVVVRAYLYQGGDGLWRLAVTPIGATVPADAITIYNLTIPPNSTDATDANLASVTITDVRRIERHFPLLIDAPATFSPVINTLSANDYRIDYDVVSAVGAPCDTDQIITMSRATNGFTLSLAAAADTVVVRWKISKLNN